MELFYNRLNYNNLLNILRTNQLARESLVYMVDFKRHKDLEVEPHSSSIEIYNEGISVFIYLFHGCVHEVYYQLELKSSNNHIISLSNFDAKSKVYKKVKYVSLDSWLNIMIEFSENSFCQDLKILKKIDL